MGTILMNGKLYSDALDYFSKVLKRFPTDGRSIFPYQRFYYVNSLFALGMIHYELRELDKARKVYVLLQSFLDRDPPNRKDTDKIMKVEKNLSIIDKELMKSSQ
jgi:tetratricopeptide (TPR) repeat protein